ncbi:hypothetical protein [Nereida sp. MMG025]|uniref:hypothetical protein n=1 Tax=Nereida sp. MMG025 TaxID=2909981 RepID=UPI001F296029|nr:hypothetical protein [Nereida sp. MMG025]MCF6443158.1 hypothetical protein [Nereida sp. MMG025]
MPDDHEDTTQMKTQMTELIGLLTAVLDSHKDRDIAANLQALVAEFESIRTLIMRHATAMEALIPRATLMEQMVEEQEQLKAMVSQIRIDTAWVRHQLEGSIDG